jgi:hypothetical protein
VRPRPRARRATSLPTCTDHWGLSECPLLVNDDGALCPNAPQPTSRSASAGQRHLSKAYDGQGFVDQRHAHILLPLPFALQTSQNELASGHVQCPAQQQGQGQGHDLQHGRNVSYSLQLTCFTEASAWATFRVSAHSSAMPCSAAAMVLAVGAFTTRQPNCRGHQLRRAVSHKVEGCWHITVSRPPDCRCSSLRRPTSVAAVRSTLSTPTPARPTTLRRPPAASKMPRVTYMVRPCRLIMRPISSLQPSICAAGRV